MAASGHSVGNGAAQLRLMSTLLVTVLPTPVHKDPSRQLRTVVVPDRLRSDFVENA